MPRFILTALGSDGDLHPFLGLAKVLKARGHDVFLIANPVQQQAIESAGIQFLPVGTKQDYYDTINNPQLWDKLNAADVVSKMAGQLVKPILDHILQLNITGQTVVVASSLAFGARVAQDALKIPTATVHLQPAVLISTVMPGKYAGLPDFSFLPQWWWKLVFRLADVMWDKNVAKPINDARAAYKLPPVKRILTRYGNSPSRVIGFWPDFFAPMAPDWPSQVRLAGFPYYDGEDVYPIDPKLEQYLLDGEPPVCVSLGTANKHSAQDYTSAIQSILRLGQRGLILTRHPEQLPPLPVGIVHFEYAPFSKILPRCKALIHHGGVGTTAQAIRAGCPQLILPMTHDQPDNANRVEKLGIGRALCRGASQKRIEQELRFILHHSSIQAKAGEFAKLAVQTDGLKNAADWVEEMV